MFDEANPGEIIEWAISRYADMIMTTGLNLSGTVLLDIANKAGFDGKVVFVDTGFHFPETLKFWDDLQKRYQGVSFVKLRSETDTGLLFESNPVQCCELNKVAPLNLYLSENNPSALLNARTRDSAQGRKDLVAFEPGAPAHINPLFKWTRSELESYAESESLEIHPLYRSGFLSMGCWPCTKAVRPGDDARSGRFVGQGRTECGLWGTVGAEGATQSR